jgi:hypothetical protein
LKMMFLGVKIAIVGKKGDRFDSSRKSTKKFRN